MPGNIDPPSVEVVPADGNEVRILSISPTEQENSHQGLALPKNNNLASALEENIGRVVQLNISFDKTIQCRIKNVFLDTSEDGSIKTGGMVLIEKGTNTDDKKDQLLEMSKIDSLEGVPDDDITMVGNHLKRYVTGSHDNHTGCMLLKSNEA